jgi:hypothetical protein
MHKLQKLFAALALAGLACSAQASGRLVITPSANSVQQGSSFTVAVAGTSFTDEVIGGGFNLSFDAALFSLDSVAIDASWEFARSGGLVDNASGSLVDAYFNTFSAPRTGDFAVATLTFTAKAPGNGTLALAGSPSFPFANVLAEVIDVNYGSARMAVTAVPEPATWATLVAGLALLGTRRRPVRG